MAWKEVDRDTFVQRNEVAQARRGGMQFDYFKPKVGPAGKPEKNVLRIMPPHENMEDVFVEVKMHFLPSNEVDQKSGRVIPIGINCLAQYGEDCPACQHVERLDREAKNVEDAEEQAPMLRQAKDQSSKVRIFANVVDLEHPDKNVQRYAFGTDIEKKLRLCFFDDDGQFRNITHPKTGRDVLLFVQKKAGTDFNDYTGTRAKESGSPLVDMDWLDTINDLSELAKKPTRDDVLKALRGERSQQQKPAAVAKPATKPVQTAAVKPAPASAVKPAPAAAKAAPPPAAAAKPKRQPVAETTTEETSDDPWAEARAAVIEAGFNEPYEITPEQAEKIKKPPCFTVETDPTDAMCQGCQVLLPCLTAKLAAAA